jgi:hypothetical protein
MLLTHFVGDAGPRQPWRGADRLNAFLDFRFAPLDE